MFIHNISLKHNSETTASNLFQASLLRSVVGEFYLSRRKNVLPAKQTELTTVDSIKILS